MTAIRTPELDRMTRDMIEYRQRYVNQMYDNISRSVGYVPQIAVPDDNSITLEERIDRLAEPEINRPNINHRLSARLVNASSSDITFRILMEAYMIVTYGNIEPDGLWASPHMYMRVRDLITSQPEFARTITHGEITGVRFMAADLHRDETIPPDEILLFNSRYPEYSARIVNIGGPVAPQS